MMCGLWLTAVAGVVMGPSALAAPSDKCASTMRKVTASWSKVVQDIDKRTASEAAKAGTTGATAYKVAMTLLEALAKQARATGREEDLAAARHLDDAVTQLKVIVPTAAAIAAWGEANKVCDEVKLIAHADPNTVCEATGGQSSKIVAACRKCDAATAKMLQLASGTPAGEHNIEDLLKGTVEDIDSLLAGLDEPEFNGSTLAVRQKATLTKPLTAMKAALQAALASSAEGEAAWEIYDDLRGEMISPALVEKVEKLGRHGKYAKELRTACQPPEPAGKCEEECRKHGRCVEVPDGRRTKCVATSDAGCAASDECRNEGHCKAVDEWCRATSDAQCAASVLCRDTGRCTAAKGSCRKGAATAEECRTWNGCANDGECSLHDGICVVGSPEDCANSTRCRKAGACGFHLPGTTDNPFLTPSQIQTEISEADPRRFRCKALKSDHCEQSSACTEEARCSLKYGTCYLTNDSDCQMSKLCREKGGCAYSQKLGCCFDPRFPFRCVY